MVIQNYLYIYYLLSIFSIIISLYISYLLLQSNYISSVSTFSSQRLVFEEKNEPFLLENSLELTHEIYV